MARTDKSSAVQVLEIFERLLRIGSVQELSRATGSAIDEAEEQLRDQLQIDQDTRTEIDNILQEAESRFQARPRIALPEVASVPIIQPSLPGADQKTVLEREQELGFKPII